MSGDILSSQSLETKNTKPQKGKGAKVWGPLAILIILIGAVVYFFGPMSWFGPKDLGIRYAQADYNNAIQQTGMHITADLGNGQTYDNQEILSGSDTATGYTGGDGSEAIKIKDLSFKDFDWKFSNYQQKTIRVSDVEATAFFNEIAPAFWWFQKTQVKINPDGTIVTSSSANVGKMKKDLFGDVAGNIPVPIPNSINLYTEGDFSITNNKISMTPTVMTAGNLSLPENMKSGSNLAAFSGYLERFYTVIPDLKINKAGLEGSGFVFDGIIPTEVNITPKQ